MLWVQKPFTKEGWVYEIKWDGYLITVMDEEVVSFDENGKISFDVAQKANPDAPLTYYIFDLCWLIISNLLYGPVPVA